MSAFHNNSLIGSSNQGYTIARSVRLRSSASAYFNRTPASASNRRTWTYSGWVKRGLLTTRMSLLGGYTGTTNGTLRTDIDFQDGAALYIGSDQMQTATDFNIVTTQIFRDPSAWYHIVVAFDTTQSTSTDRVKVYVNGVQVTAFSTASYPSLNYQGGINFNNNQYINRWFDSAGGSYYGDGYVTEVNFIDGQALTPSSFGETNPITGVWQPKRYAGTYGTNGFYLNFSDNSNNTATTIGKDYSGNGNNWTPNNISVTAGVTYDSMLDVPTPYADGGNGRGNYCTLNPLYKGTNVNPTEANLKFAMTSGNFHEGITGTIFPTSGKWYAEFRWNTVTSATTATAVCRNNAAMNTITCAFQNTVDTNSPTYRSYIVNGNKDTNTTTAAYGSTYTANDIIGVALDLDNNKVWFSKNGTWQASGDPAAGTNAAFTDITGSDGWTFAVSGYGSGGDNCNANFGQRPFSYTPPTGFVALNTQNLPDATIKKGNQYFDATTYTGTGASLAVVNSGAFQPDFVWTKVRNNTYSNHLEDAVRGVGQRLLSDSTVVEATGTNGKLTSFNSNGFTQDGGVEVGASAGTYVAWQWNAGGSTVTNTSGSISAQVRANPTAGFSVVTGTFPASGTSCTFGHGLGVAPSMIISKGRDGGTSNWIVRHTSLGNMTTKYLEMNNTGAVGTGPNAATAPSSTLASVSTDGLNNNMAFVAYCFAAVAGYSAFGSYTGNGSTDGPFVYLGFRPRWLMIRNITNAQPWIIVDTSRNTYNQAGDYLQANSSAAENGGSAVSTATADDILSNGFKLRNNASSSGYTNGSGNTYIYAAFAEVPFKSALGR